MPVTVAPIWAEEKDSAPKSDAASYWTSNEIPSDEILESRGAVIGDIVILTDDVFDPEHPGEKYKIYELANRLHRTTRPDVIRRQLLFREGDAFSRGALEESERILRRNRYLFDAEIRVVEYRANRVRVEVRTRDVWTLRPGLSIGRSGGVNTTDIKVQDFNLFGSGKSVTVKHSSDVDRDTLFIRYDDRHLLGRWMHLKLHYGDSSDGGVRLIQLDRPFFSLNTRWAAGFKFYDEDRIDSLYSLGEMVDHFQHKEKLFEIHGGLSRGLRRGRAYRWTAGLSFEEHRFGQAEPPPRPVVDSDVYSDLLFEKDPSRFPRRPRRPLAEKAAPSVLIPDDRTLVYPWVGFESLGDDYAKTRSLDQMGRTEDLELGYRYRARVGYASRSFGGDRDAAVFDARISAGFRPTERQILLLHSEISGRWGEEGGEDIHWRGRGRFYWRNFGRHLFYVNVEADATYNLDSESQLLLGGDSGLRGYPLRYQDGEERLLVSLEQRIFTDLYPFRLFYVGAAVFLDVGRTWGSGMSEDLGLLRDAGFGLRLSSSRSGQGSVLHLDVAFPLDGDDSIDSVQWLVSTKNTF